MNKIVVFLYELGLLPLIGVGSPLCFSTQRAEDQGKKRGHLLSIGNVARADKHLQSSGFIFWWNPKRDDPEKTDLKSLVKPIKIVKLDTV